MAAEAEVLFEDLTQFEEQEEAEAAVLEELLREAEEAALQQELSEKDLNPHEDDNANEVTDQTSSEKEESSSHEDSTFLESAETDDEVEDVNEMVDVDWGNPEVIEVVEEDILEESFGIENTTEEEIEEEEDNSIVITSDELQLNDEAQELLEEDQTVSFLEEDEDLNLEGIEEVTDVQEVPEITELDQHDEHMELDDMEEDVHQEEPEELPDVEEFEQHEDHIELEETEELETLEQGDVVDFQDPQEEDGNEEALIDTDLNNLDEEYPVSDNFEEQEEEFSETGLVPGELLEGTNLDYVIEEQHSATITEISVPADIETLEKEFSQISKDYQSVFTPEEQDLAQFMADLLLFETIQARNESHISNTTTTEKQELLTPNPYTVSFDEEILPPISLDHYREEVSSLEEELAQIESPRAFQHFHEQLQESQLQILTIDPQLSLENLADDLKLVTQRTSPPEPPPYDFLDDLESYEEHEVEARIQELKNPLYPYHPQRNRLQKLKHVRPKIIQAKASTPSTQYNVPKSEPHDAKHNEQSWDQQALPIEGGESSSISPQKISQGVLSELQVPSTRGVIKLQIEALTGLKSLNHKIDPTNKSNRIITLKASNRIEMGEVLIDKMGDLTYPREVRRYGKRFLIRIKKEENWKPMKLFIVDGRAEKEVYNPTLDQTGWVIHNKKKGWDYTGNQRIVTTVKMDLLNVYYSKLEERARTLAANTEQTRIHLSKYDKISSEYRDKLRFWTHYGYRPPEPTKIYLTKQQKWSVSHVALNGSEILLKALLTGQVSNPNLGKVAETWTNDHKEIVNSSRIMLHQQGKPLTLNQILPKDLVNDLQSRKIDINCLNENKGAPYVFKFQLEKIKNDLVPEIRNVLTEYLNIDSSIVESCRFDVDWGIVKDRSKVLGMDKYDQEFRYTFAPDVVVEDQHGKIIAVIQLKGLTQNKHAITATISVIQMIELIKYHVEHEVPVALVNIKHDEQGLRYEWLIIDKANTSPSPDLQQLIEPKTGLDPLLPRNARSYAFVETIYQRLRSHNNTIDLRNEFNEFQNLINKSQLNFQKLRFYKSAPKYLDGKKYWYKLVQKADELGLSRSQNIKFDKFYKKWKKMVVEDFKDRLLNLK